MAPGLRIVRAGTVTLVAVLAFTGCSSSGKSGPSTTAPTDSADQSGSASKSAAAPTGSAFKLGVICSCSGPFGTQTGAAGSVAKAWVKSVNASGGLGGHPVKLTFKDDASNPGTSVTAAQSIIDGHPDAILDLSILDSAWAKTASAAKIPVIGGNFSTSQYYTDSNWYPSGQTNDSIVYANVATAKTAGGTKLGLLYCAEAPQCQESVSPTKDAAKAQGLSLPYKASIAATAPNYTAQCLAAKQAKVDALIILDGPAVIMRVASDCVKQGYSPAFVEEGTSFTDLNLTAPGLKDHLWAPFTDIPYFSDLPSVQEMNTVVDKYSPGLRKDAKKWSSFATQSWSGLKLLEKAITAAGIKASDTVTPAAVVTGLDKTTNETLGGFTPPLTFTAGKPHSVGCWFTGRVQGGKATMVNGGRVTCHSG